jgi:S1-C subfamily serine protease
VLGVILAAALVGALPASESRDWEATLRRVAPAVVVLRVSATRPFDTENPGTYVATGFVVDAERGLILTNRHVVGPGPVVAEAVFQNHEEVEVRAVYRDPVHDFGLFRFDPDDVRFIEPAELELAPERARVGVEVRVVGNDAGEKLSILAGTLARLDREAPDYGQGRYNDFNTFYLQAASNTSGGSSGSPVVDISGKVVGLNAGGRSQAASSFYLPLDRVVRALALLREGRDVPRGTLEAVFRHEPYDELRRLGLREATEGEARRQQPGAIGMLVVGEVVPGGPADGVLQPGDVLVRVQGRLVTDFVPLEAALDDAVGGEVELEVERGGAPLAMRLRVGDLHAVTPASYLEVGGAVLNTFSLQQARNYGIRVGGPYVTSPGYMLRRAGIPRGAVITAVGGQPTPDLASLEAALAALPDGQRVPVRFFRVSSPRTQEVSVVPIDRRWHPMQRCERDDATGVWPCVASPPPPAAPPAASATTSFRGSGDRRARQLERSLALVRFHVPYRVDGVPGDTFVGAGLVVDAARGLVVVDRDTVPVALGDATLTFAGAVEIPAEVVHLHPVHNLAVIRYDPSLLGDTPVRSAELREADLAPGDDVWLIGLTESQQIVSESSQVSRVELANLPLPTPPRFRESNAELVTLTEAPPTVGGVVADRSGRVVALWASVSSQSADGPRSFFAGIPSELIEDVLRPLRDGVPTGWRSLGAELKPLSLADARSRGLSEEAARRLDEHDPSRRDVLSVLRIAADAPAAKLLQEGDLLLAVDGQPVVRVRELERAVALAQEQVTLLVLRDGQELTLPVPTQELSGGGTRRALLWAGALLQDPHAAIATQRGLPPEGVYVAWFFWGSPAHRHRLEATRRILAVDGSETPDLDAFLAAVSGRPDRGSIRLRTVDLDGKVEVITLKLDLHYWPTWELGMTPAGWVRSER